MRDLHKEFDDDFEKANQPVEINVVEALLTAGYVGVTCQQCGKKGDDCQGCYLSGMKDVFDDVLKAMPKRRKGAPPIPVEKQVAFMPAMIALLLDWHFDDACKDCEDDRGSSACKDCTCNDLSRIWHKIVLQNKIGKTALAEANAKKTTKKGKPKKR